MSNENSGGYSNFNDPVGLAFRMLKRATRESVGPLLQMACEIGAKPFDHIAARWECYDERNDDIPQLLIVGLPRTGTTMVSQLLARYLDVSYFPNVSAIFPSAPIWATKRFVGDFSTAPKTTKNFYGSTAGFQGISDGFHIWNRWFGSDRYCIGHLPNDDEVADLQAFFFAWNGVFNKTLLNKNNRNVDGIASLAQFLPNAFFVVVERDPAMTIQSLLQARRFVQGSDSTGWGLFSNRFDTDSDPIRSVCKQVAFGIHRLEEQLSHVSQDRIVRFSYEDFCGAPTSALESVLELVSGVRMRPRQDLGAMPPLQANSKVSLPQEQWKKIQEEFSEARTQFAASDVVTEFPT